MKPQLTETITRPGPNGETATGLQWNFHPGPLKAWNSTKRIILVTAGWQSGKSVIGSPWLAREIERCGPGDYLVASPSYPLMMKKVLPEFLRLLEAPIQTRHLQRRHEEHFHFQIQLVGDSGSEYPMILFVFSSATPAKPPAWNRRPSRRPGWTKPDRRLSGWHRGKPFSAV